MKEKLLLSPKQVKPSFRNWTVKGVLNPGGIRLASKKILLMARVAEEAPMHKGKSMHCPVIASKTKYKARMERISPEAIRRKEGNTLFLKNGTCRLTTVSHLRKIVLDKSGFETEKISQKPDFTGTETLGRYGVEDARITRLGKEYAMTFASISHNEGVSTELALSKDLRKWKRQGIIFREQNKDVVIFPEKINGKFVALHRPEGNFVFSKPSIWISYSKDLIYWGKEKSIVQPRKGWEEERIGGGTVPIKTKEGWLEIYHGVRKSGKKRVYSAGALLLGLKNPEKIIARSPAKKPLFAPEKGFERKGFVNNVVFPTAAILDLNKKDLLVYYGAADSRIAVKKMALKDILNSMVYE